MNSLRTMLLTSSAIALMVATPASAAVKSADGKHSLSGGVKVTYAADSNVGAAPAKPGGGPDTGDDDEDFDLDDLMENEDALEDVLDDMDVDIDDFAEDDAGDEDGDGILDLIDDEDSDGGDEDGTTVGSAPGKGRGDGDERVQTGLALKHAYNVNDDNSIVWKSGANLGFNDPNDRGDQDRRNWAINTGPEFAFKSIGVKINPSITYADMDVNGLDQMHSTIASLGVSWKATKSLAFSARYNREMRINEKPRATDLHVDALNFGAKYVYGKNLFSATFSPKFEDNDNRLKNKDKVGYGLGYSRKLPYKIQADLGFRYGITDFGNLAAPGREDDDYQYTAKLTKQFAHGMYADVGALHRSRDSNLNKQDNNGQSIFASVGWKF